MYKAHFTPNKYKLIYLSKTLRRFNITININIIKIIIKPKPNIKILKIYIDSKLR